MFSLNVKVVEITIPVPWGHISGKAWGDEKNEIVLVFHGIMDNAGSFDHLIPLLPEPFYYVCIDLPSHGMSSHFPAHLPIYSLNFILAYRLIVEYFNRKKIIIMGHSYGGQLGFLFAQLYPQYVEKLILLDTIALFPVGSRIFKIYLEDKFDSHLLLEQKLSTKNEPPAYTYTEAIDKIQLGRFTPITTGGAVALSHRVLVPTGDGRYMFGLDQRMKNIINPLRDFRYVLETLKLDPVTCPTLIILGEKSKAQIKYMKQILNALKKQKNISIKMVKGDHDVHNDSPEIVAPHIQKFLLYKKGKL